MGYVYILVNASMPGLIKIGKTDRNCRKRAKEISDATGVPTPFTVAYELSSERYEWLEDEIHSVLAEYCVNRNREFFSFPLDGATKVLKALHTGEPSSRIGVLKALYTRDPIAHKNFFITLERSLKDPRTRDDAVSTLFSYIDKYQHSFDEVIRFLVYVVDSGNWSDKSYKTQTAVTWLRRSHSSDAMQALYRYKQRVALQRVEGKMDKNVHRKNMMVNLLAWLRSKIGTFFAIVGIALLV